MANNTTGRTTKPKQGTKGTKAKTNTTKTSKAPVKDIAVKDKTAKPEVVDLFDKMEVEKPSGWKDKNSPVIGNNGFDLAPGDNSKVITDMLYIYQMPRINLDSEEEVQERILEYFQYCIGRDIRPGVEGMAMALGVNRRTLWDWEQGNSRGNSIVRSDTIKKSKQFLALYLENLAQTGHINPVTWIFMMKNNFGYKDTQDLVITPNNALQPTMSMEEIADKVAKDVVIDTDYSE
jgi:hypothetical protein